jgi:uncharacterized ParB-like nuclease family protein
MQEKEGEKKNFKVTLIPISRLSKASWNYKTNNMTLSRKLTENIKRNGILQPSIVYQVKDDYVVLDGNHRLDSYQQLGIEKVPCVNLGKISDNDAKRISIEINETKFESDFLKLSNLIKDIKVDYNFIELEVTMPFSVEELQNMEKSLDMDWDKFNGKDNEDSENKFNGEPHMATCPKCKHIFEV